MRGATLEYQYLHILSDISIHAPHARSDERVRRGIHIAHIISIHAPHARSDHPPESQEGFVLISIHAPHARSDAHNIGINKDTLYISIHAPHARSDTRQFPDRHICRYFNPRSSCEERPVVPCTSKRYGLFQSTLLMRGATACVSTAIAAGLFQSTLLMRGATRR